MNKEKVKKKKRGRRPLPALAVSVALVTFLLYLPSLRNQFVNWDDDAYIYQNPSLSGLNARFLKWAFFAFYDANYHPLTWISHALDYAVWGLNPLGHHLTNNVLHAVNAALVVFIAAGLINAGKRKTGGPESFPSQRGVLVAATVSGLLFGVHPLHVESVAWVAERKDVLCALFFLLSILMYMKYARRGGPMWPPKEGQPHRVAPTQKDPGQAGMTNPGLRFLDKRYLLCLFFFVLALLSKPMAVTLPAVLLVLDWYPFERIRSLKTFRAAFVEKLPLFALGLAASVVAVLAQKSGRAIISTEVMPVPVRVAVAAEAIFSYLGKMVLPVNLIPFYPYPEGVSLLSPRYLLFVVLVIGVTAACLAAARKKKVWGAAWGYYLVTLLPVLGIIQAGFQSKADRYTYLPSLGPFLMIGLAAAWVYEKTMEGRRAVLMPAAASAAALLLVLMSYATVKQTGIWKNSITLWNYVIETKSEKSAVAYYHRGIAYFDLKLLDPAIGDYTRAIRMKPDYYEAYNNRGVSYEEKGQPDLAIEDYSTSIRLHPHFKVFGNRGNAYLTKGLRDKAEEDFRRAVLLNPQYDDGYNGLGMVSYLNGRYESALEDFNRAIGLNPKNSGALVNRGYVYLNKGERRLAGADFTEACLLGNRNGCSAARRLQAL